MAESDLLLTAIAADPADDALWLVFADWLEEQGNPLSDRVRKTVETGKWDKFCEKMVSQLRPRQVQLFVCECLFRLLPIYESKYPENREPRDYLETLMRFASGKGVNAAKAAMDAMTRALYEDFQRDPEEFDLASTVFHNVRNCRQQFPMTYHTCARVAARAAFGPGFDFEKSWETPRWRSLTQLEYRWQAPRILRYLLSDSASGVVR